jgi:multidrug resistance protein MdtO
MSTLAQSATGAAPRAQWLWEFLREELAPSPGRVATVARMVIAATLVMIVCMTFRLPYAFQATIYAFLISRENPRATLESAGIMVLFTFLGTASVLIVGWFSISFPLLHLLSNIILFLLAFYAFSVMTNYAAAASYAIVIAAAVPFWDQHLSGETNLENTLRLTLGVSIGTGITVLVELLFARLRPGDEILVPIARRLSALQALLTCYADDCPADDARRQTVARLAVLGTSSLRRALNRSGYAAQYHTEMSGVVSLAGRLIDVAAALTQFRFAVSPDDRERFRRLAAVLDEIRLDLLNRRVPAAIKFEPEISGAVPLLGEMEQIVALIPEAFSGSRTIHEYVAAPDDIPRPKLFARDALPNPEHLKFALKGTLATTACYIIYNAVDWPEISTALTTCMLTALSTIGASRQKQILRLGGAVAGGLIGMGAQIFILPNVDSIYGFTILFMMVTALASWILTSSPRLSYFGLQLALAFYLIHLQEFALQTSLRIARDRIAGILLGLFMMWAVFDQLWSAPSGVEMKRSLVRSIRLLAQLAREPISSDQRIAIKESFALRDTINAQFDKTRSFADGVLLEFGASRGRDLLLRDRIRRWQPQLRTLFLMRISSIKYRFRLPGFEMPDDMVAAQAAYDECSARMLEGAADRIDGGMTPSGTPANCSAALEKIMETCRTEEAGRVPATRVQSFAALLSGIERLTTSLAEDIAADENRANPDN